MFQRSKNLFLTLSFALSGLLSLPAFAQAAQVRVGIVSVQDAIMATNDGKKEAEALQQRFGPKQNELKRQDDELQKLKTDLQTQGDKLSEEARANRIKEATEKQKVFQRNYEDYQAEVQAASQDVLNRLGKKMMDVLDKYSKANGYTVVLDVSNPQTPVLWASPSSNFTKELVDAYNAEAPTAPAPKPTAGGTAPPKKP